MADDTKIPALLRKDVIATPLPFTEAQGVIGATCGSIPAAPAINFLSHDENTRREFAMLQQQAQLLQQQHGINFAVGNAVCEACGTEFAAVAPASESVFPCPRCRTHRARWKFNFIKPGPHWACGCGNVTFRVAQTGVYCPQCGQDQELPNFVKG